MSQIAKIAQVLSKHNDGAGITPDRIAKLAKVSRDAVYKRVSDLRNEGTTIYSNYRTVKGKRQLFYRMAS